MTALLTARQTVSSTCSLPTHRRLPRQHTMFEIPTSWVCLACVSRVRTCLVLGIAASSTSACLKWRSGWPLLSMHDRGSCSIVCAWRTYLAYLPRCHVSPDRHILRYARVKHKWESCSMRVIFRRRPQRYDPAAAAIDRSSESKGLAVCLMQWPS